VLIYLTLILKGFYLFLSFFLSGKLFALSIGMKASTDIETLLKWQRTFARKVNLSVNKWTEQDWDEFYKYVEIRENKLINHESKQL
jgi:hypothetical protein